MDTERFVGQKVLVELVIKRIVEGVDGISYDVHNPDSSLTINVPSEAIKEESC